MQGDTWQDSGISGKSCSVTEHSKECKASRAGGVGHLNQGVQDIQSGGAGYLGYASSSIAGEDIRDRERGRDLWEIVAEALSNSESGVS